MRMRGFSHSERMLPSSIFVVLKEMSERIVAAVVSIKYAEELRNNAPKREE